MAREREARSHVRRRRRGCLTGCLTNLLLLLGLAALLFVGAHVLGFVTTDPQTGAPSITFENVGELPKFDLSGVKLPDMDGAAGKLWAYGVRPHGLTVKTLRAGAGEAVLVAADGYTLLLGGGSGTGALLCTQMLLSRVNRLSAAVAMGSEDAQIGALPLAMTMAAPQYLFYQDSQVKGKAYHRMLEAAQKHGTQAIVPVPGFSFTLGRARVTFVGPAVKHHTQSRDDGLSLRIDYGNTSVLVLGGVTAAGEREIVSSGAYVQADALICSGEENTAGAEIVAAVQPKIALVTSKQAANSVRIRLERAGAEVCAMKENGVMTLYSDGQTMTVER